ncbi:MAG: hypothetical protein V2I43_01550 [Parvularcula sp.]|jgi:hypothetical protein|nr:hypothetical protein [Parvularcula sp.]
MKKITALLAATILSLVSAAFAQNADQVTPGVIYGSGNNNEAFTIDRQGSIEVGLRGKLRFDENNAPQSVYNYDGVDTYTFDPAFADPGFGFTPGVDPTWNFDWSVNVNLDGQTGASLSDYIYRLELDVDPSAGFDFLTFDPINVPCADHALGTNASSQSNRTITNCGSATAGTDYQSNLAQFNLAQQSWSYSFFSGILAGFDPTDAGLYTIRLSVFEPADQLGTALASSSINIRALNGEVPLPGAALFMAAGLAGLGAARRSRTKRS